MINSSKEKTDAVTLRRDEFLELFEDVLLPEAFDQHLLDRAAEMFEKWGKTSHLDEKEHLFEAFGLAERTEDGEELRLQKAALRFVCRRMMEAGLGRRDAAELIRGFNRIKDPGYRWLE
ncbi:MAG TPA: hypothetical protein PLN19_00965 [Methanothrix sp.]|nr:hypothetical protein [Methanothrix sp.]HOV81617.1 hypothetical protein [Methanothrix sp.]HPC88753.1 hypothetical protein [Methanothrix sp.]HQE86819.1 hypothetical protein [Methanothrix sp.]HQI68101.1 hypothetical protein [Methanothrix sp.]